MSFLEPSRESDPFQMDPMQQLDNLPKPSKLDPSLDEGRQVGYPPISNMYGHHEQEETQTYGGYGSLLEQKSETADHSSKIRDILSRYNAAEQQQKQTTTQPQQPTIQQQAQWSPQTQQQQQQQQPQWAPQTQQQQQPPQQQVWTQTQGVHNTIQQQTPQQTPQTTRYQVAPQPTSPPVVRTQQQQPTVQQQQQPMMQAQPAQIAHTQYQQVQQQQPQYQQPTIQPQPQQQQFPPSTVQPQYQPQAVIQQQPQPQQQQYPASTIQQQAPVQYQQPKVEAVPATFQSYPSLPQQWQPPVVGTSKQDIKIEELKLQQQQAMQMMEQMQTQFNRIMNFFETVDRRLTKLEGVTQEILSQQAVVTVQYDPSEVLQAAQQMQQVENDAEMARRLQDELNRDEPKKSVSKPPIKKEEPKKVVSSGFVDCPVCSKKIAEKDSEEHVNSCLDKTPGGAEKAGLLKSWWSKKEDKATPKPDPKKTTTSTPTPNPVYPSYIVPPTAMRGYSPQMMQPQYPAFIMPNGQQVMYYPVQQNP